MSSSEDSVRLSWETSENTCSTGSNSISFYCLPLHASIRLAFFVLEEVVDRGSGPDFLAGAFLPGSGSSVKALNRTEVLVGSGTTSMASGAGFFALA